MNTSPPLNALMNRYGFVARVVPQGYFLAPLSKDRFGHRHVGDDVMLVRSNGEIVPYAHDAQAFLAAKVLSGALT